MGSLPSQTDKDEARGQRRGGGAKVGWGYALMVKFRTHLGSRCTDLENLHIQEG